MPATETLFENLKSINVFLTLLPQNCTRQTRSRIIGSDILKASLKSGSLHQRSNQFPTLQ